MPGEVVVILKWPQDVACIVVFFQHLRDCSHSFLENGFPLLESGDQFLHALEVRVDGVDVCFLAASSVNVGHLLPLPCVLLDLLQNLLALSLVVVSQQVHCSLAKLRLSSRGLQLFEQSCQFGKILLYVLAFGEADFEYGWAENVGG